MKNFSVDFSTPRLFCLLLKISINSFFSYRSRSSGNLNIRQIQQALLEDIPSDSDISGLSDDSENDESYVPKNRVGDDSSDDDQEVDEQLGLPNTEDPDEEDDRLLDPNEAGPSTAAVNPEQVILLVSKNRHLACLRGTIYVDFSTLRPVWHNFFLNSVSNRVVLNIRICRLKLIRIRSKIENISSHVFTVTK